MSVVVIGLNHRTAPLELLERLTIDDARQHKALADVAGRDNISEAVVLSTCNRTEIYAVAERFHGAYRDIRDFLADWSFLPPEEFSDHLYVHYDDIAVDHLFGVAAGLDSAVLGEHEILGQVRAAWELALGEGATGTQLNMLFRHALEVGKRARTETAIARNIASVSTAAVAMAAERLEGLAGRSILVLGAGEMAEGMVRALAAADVAEVLIANRTWDRAAELADQVAGRAVRLQDLDDSLRRVDLLLTSTGASSLIVEHGDLEAAVDGRDGRPLLIVDVAVPRDVDPGAGDLDGVTLLDMDDLRDFAEAGVAERRREVAAVRAILDEEVERYTAVASAREVAPLVAALHTWGEEVRSAELTRLAARLGELDDRQLAAVESLTKGIVAKLLHDPTVRLKDAAGSVKGERLAEALRDLFDLSPAAPVRIATRGSALARWQADHVGAALTAAGGAYELVLVETFADRRQDVEIAELGGKGVFVKEVQAAVLDGRADLAVHSAKDLPAVTPDELVLACVPERADPRDVLVGAELERLASGATIATGSQRRQVQLAVRRPDLTFVGLRGNIATRLTKIPAGGAVVMAAAALARLGLAPDVVDVLGVDVLLPQVGQGALAVECRADDDARRAALAALEHRPSRRAVDAERAFLGELGGDCDLPAGAHAVATGDDDELVLTGFLAPDGVVPPAAGKAPVLVRSVQRGVDAESLGRAVARAVRG